MSSPDRRRHLDDDDDTERFNTEVRRPTNGFYDVDLDRPLSQLNDGDNWRKPQNRPNYYGDEIDNNNNHRPDDQHADQNVDDEDERMADGGWANGRIRVAELRVRLPNGGPEHGGSWVRVEKCQFQPSNRTLETRLSFPDLTISGRVQMQPSFNRRADISGKSNGARSCSMILRLRQAGIEFRTIPLVEQRSRTAAVRTDSYFADPGFISVFAHGCDDLMAAATGFHGRTNSKRSPFSIAPDHQREQRSAPVQDAFNFDGDIMGNAMGDWGDMLAVPQDRSWAADEENSADERRRRPTNWQNVELASSAERDEQYTRDLEDLFSKGVRGLLTTYMQRALQPAIKETLMESLGYRLSYG